MARRKRQSSTFNLSFLDIMSCGFGAVVLVFLIIDHSMEIEIRTVNAEVLSEVALLEEDIVDGEAGLVRLRNALTEADLEIVEADGRARRITEELDEYESLIASIEESDVSDSDVIAKLQAEINQLEELTEKFLQEMNILKIWQFAFKYIPMKENDKQKCLENSLFNGKSF